MNTTELLNLEWNADWNSRNFKVIQLYLELEKFHIGKPEYVAAYLKAINDRFRFFKQQSYIPYEESSECVNYENAANALIERFKNIPEHTLIAYHLAQYHFDQSPVKYGVHRFRNESNDDQKQKIREIHRKKAIELAKESIKLFPETYGAKQGENLLNQIYQPSLKLDYKNHIAPDLPIQASIYYRNLEKVRIYFRRIPFHDSYKTNDSLLTSLFNRSKSLNNFELIKDIQLPNSDDTFKRLHEIVIPGLPIGNYLMTLEFENDDGNQREMSVLKVTSLGVFSGWDKKQLSYQVLDKTTGFPLSDVELKVYNEETEKVHIAKTDAQGRALIKQDYLHSEDFAIMASKKNDSTYIYDFNYNDNTDNDDELETLKQVKTIVYLDRAIYRPGQEVFFKVIAVVNENGKKRVLPNEKLNIYITAPNNKEVYDADFTTNEYGSFHGSFILPEQVMLGEFEINLDFDEETAFWDDVDDVNDYDVIKTFKVEEYKRPRFEIVFERDDHDYIVNDSVQIKAIATAYLGASIADAKVSYTIKRRTYVPWWKRSNYDDNRLIKQSTFEKDSLKTNSKGEILIDFIAEVDEFTLNRFKDATYTYDIEVKIVDANGETQLATTSINGVAQPYRIVLNTPEQLDQKINNIEFYLENLEKEKLGAKVRLEVFKTDVNADDDEHKPNKLITSEFNQKELDSIFSSNLYYKTILRSKKDSLVYNKTISITGIEKLNLPIDKTWMNGHYKFVLTVLNDSLNEKNKHSIEKITTEKVVKIWTDKSLPLNKTIISHNQEIIDGRLKLDLFTSADSVFVTLHAYSKSKSLYEENFFIYQGKNTQFLDYTQEPGSTTSFQYYTLKDNHLYSNIFEIQRNCLKKLITPLKPILLETSWKPGFDEKWSFNIQDDAGNPFKAEVLASMYDQSLNAFATNIWDGLDFRNKDEYYYNRSPNNLLELKNDLSFREFYLSSRDFNKVRIVNPLENWNFYGFLNTFSTFNYQSYLIRLRLKNRKRNTDDAKFYGTVSDPNGEPIFGATVQIQNTQVFTTTDFDGNFSLDAEIGNVVVISYSGYDPVVYKLSDLGFVTITLSTSLDQVVVTGYRTVGRTKQIIGPKNGMPTLLQGQMAGISQVSISTTVYTTQLPTTYNPSENADQPIFFFREKLITKKLFDLLSKKEIKELTYLNAREAILQYGDAGKNGVIFIEPVVGFTYQDLMDLNKLGDIQPRKDLKETAFFFPQLYTDDKGSVSFSFNSPEMLTRWKFQLLGHNKNAETAYLSKEVVTQKELSLVPNPPRFVRENDTLVFKSKIINLSDGDLDVIANLELYDGMTRKKLDIFIDKSSTLKKTKVSKNKSAIVQWKLAIPENLTSLTYKIKASADNFSDGEENSLPVLSNKVLITESTSVWIPAGEKRSMKLESLDDTSMDAKQHVSLTMDYATNASWNALESLPYLMDFQHQCSEQIFAKYYANAVAAHTVSSNPEVQAMFETWSNQGSTAVERNKRNDGLIYGKHALGFGTGKKRTEIGTSCIKF